jgi:uncharacterized protein involved in response to NO
MSAGAEMQVPTAVKHPNQGRRMRWRPETRAAAWGLFAAGVLAIAIVVGSRNLSRFDAVLVAYTFAALFAVFGIAYRYSMWLQRPPTALFWRKG